MGDKNIEYPFLLPKGYHKPIKVETDFLYECSKCSVQVLLCLRFIRKNCH